MASAAQITANAANAILSTGPKTEEGKQRSSENSRKHGFSSMVPASPEEAAELAVFTEKLKAATSPHGQLEEDAFYQIRDAAWRLEKIRAATNRKQDVDPLEDEVQAAELQALSRYRAAAESQFFKSIKILQDLQTLRLARPLHMTQTEDKLVPASVPPHVYSIVNFEGFRFNRGDRMHFEKITGHCAISPNEPNPPCYS